MEALVAGWKWWRWSAAATASALTVLAAMPSASAAPTPGGGHALVVTASGLHAGASAAVIECNTANGEPMVQVATVLVPVGCSPPDLENPVRADAAGRFTATFEEKRGTVGPPCGASGPKTCPRSDSAGGVPAIDAAKFPCPPTPAQQQAGVGCRLELVTVTAPTEAARPPKSLGAQDVAYAAPTPVSQAALPPASTVPCLGVRVWGSSGPIRLWVNPGTCLHVSLRASVGGEGFQPAQIGYLAECAAAPGHATVVHDGLAWPASCIGQRRVVAADDGSLGPVSFMVRGRLPGSPFSADLPCPGLSGGPGCVVRYEDVTGRVVQVPLSFAAAGQNSIFNGGIPRPNSSVSQSFSANVLPSPAGAGTASRVPAAPGGSGGPLAFTGQRTAVMVIGAVGAVALGSGLAAVAGSRGRRKRQSA